MRRRSGSLWLLFCAACASAQRPSVSPGGPAAGPVEHALVRVHLDVTKPGALETVAGTRVEYRAWVLQVATPPGETPVFFLRVGKDGLWALRPARAWEDIPGQVRRDGEVESAVRASVGTALEGNGERMHGNILEHHNELFRFLAESSRGTGAFADVLARVRVVVLDQVIPSAGDAYADQGASRGGGARPGTHWVFVSSPGSGATVHLLGDDASPGELPDAALVRERRILEARMDPALGTVQRP